MSKTKYIWALIALITLTVISTGALFALSLWLTYTAFTAIANFYTVLAFSACMLIFIFNLYLCVFRILQLKSEYKSTPKGKKNV